MIGSAAAVSFPPSPIPCPNVSTEKERPAVVTTGQATTTVSGGDSSEPAGSVIEPIFTGKGPRAGSPATVLNARAAITPSDIGVTGAVLPGVFHKKKPLSDFTIYATDFRTMHLHVVR